MAEERSARAVLRHLGDDILGTMIGNVAIRKASDWWDDRQKKEHTLQPIKLLEVLVMIAAEGKLDEPKMAELTEWLNKLTNSELAYLERGSQEKLEQYCLLSQKQRESIKLAVIPEPLFSAIGKVIGQLGEKIPKIDDHTADAMRTTFGWARRRRERREQARLDRLIKLARKRFPTAILYSPPSQAQREVAETIEQTHLRPRQKKITMWTLIASIVVIVGLLTLAAHLISTN